MFSIRHRELLLLTPGLFEELDGFYKRLSKFLGVEHNDDGTHDIPESSSTTHTIGSLRSVTKTVTGIADNTATTVLTVSVPNTNQGAAIRLLFVSSNGITDNFESARAAQGLVVVERIVGAAAVATAAAIADGVIATTGGGATHTLAYAVGAISGAVGATNTFPITVTIDDSGNVGGNQITVYAEVLNANSTGVTIA